MFQVLNTSDAQWVNALSHLPPAMRDIHYTPEYGRLFERVNGDQALLAVDYDERAGVVLQAIINRKDKSLADIGTPYGYGGPLASLYWDQVKQFNKVKEQWKNDNEIISEFIALHPVFWSEQKSFFPKAKYIKDTAYIDLIKDPAIRKGHFSAIKQARKLGGTTDRVTPDKANLIIFKQMYDATMERCHAHDRWHFTLEYFTELFRCLGNKAALFFARLNGKLNCGAVVMHDLPYSAYVYYQFAGSFEHNRSGLNHMMVMDIAVWAKMQGAIRLHLGGGVTEDKNDSLLRFKTGFSHDRAPLYIVNQ